MYLVTVDIDVNGTHLTINQVAKGGYPTKQQALNAAWPYRAQANKVSGRFTELRRLFMNEWNKLQ